MFEAGAAGLGALGKALMPSGGGNLNPQPEFAGASPITAAPVTLPGKIMLNGKTLNLTDASVEVNFYRKDDGDYTKPLNSAPIPYSLYVDERGNPYIFGKREGAFKDAAFSRRLVLADGQKEITVGGRTLTPFEVKQKLWALAFLDPPTDNPNPQ